MCSSDLVKESAACFVADKDALTNLTREVLALLGDWARCEKLSERIGKLGRPNAAQDIVAELETLMA